VVSPPPRTRASPTLVPFQFDCDEEENEEEGGLEAPPGFGDEDFPPLSCTVTDGCDPSFVTAPHSPPGFGSSSASAASVARMLESCAPPPGFGLPRQAVGHSNDDEEVAEDLYSESSGELVVSGSSS